MSRPMQGKVLRQWAEIALQPWRAQAACKDVRRATKIFFKEGYAPDYSEAVEICRGCPVRAECRAQAEAYGENFGIWGGKDFGSRGRKKRHAPGQWVVYYVQGHRFRTKIFSWRAGAIAWAKAQLLDDDGPWIRSIELNGRQVTTGEELLAELEDDDDEQVNE